MCTKTRRGTILVTKCINKSSCFSVQFGTNSFPLSTLKDTRLPTYTQMMSPVHKSNSCHALMCCGIYQKRAWSTDEKQSGFDRCAFVAGRGCPVGNEGGIDML